MHNSRSLEVGVGLFVAAGAIALLLLALQVSNLLSWAGDGGYTIVARFDNSIGLKVRAPVTVAGVRIGEVNSVEYDAQRFQALVRMRIDDAYRELPVDSSASINSAGLLGEKYVALQPGGSYDYLDEGGVIMLTQSSLVLEQLIGQFLFNSGNKGGGDMLPLEEGDPLAQ